MGGSMIRDPDKHWCVKLVTTEALCESISRGNLTSRRISQDLGFHQGSVQKKLVEMYRDGVLVREAIGRTFVYTVKADRKGAED